MAVKFHLPDFTRNYHLNRILIELLKTYPEYFREGVEIGSVYGDFPISLWNGGRSTTTICDKTEMRTIIHSFSDLKIPMRFTYTNPLITKKHLSDDHCNAVLRMADNGINGVIVVSEELEAYIRRIYPRFTVTSSTCKQLRDEAAVCAELEKDYTMVVLDYNWNNQFDRLERLPHKEKCEILVNACCPPACPRRGEHYRYLGQLQFDRLDFYKHHSMHEEFVSKEEFTCEYPNRILYQITEYSTHVKPDDIYEKYVPMGFSNFKIEGRSNNIFNLVDTYMYYMAKPECRDQLRLIFLMTLEHNNAIEVLQ